jgi:hypothetical protein
MASNAEIEMRWVNAWDDLYELIQDRADTKCQLPDLSIVSVDACRVWLQEMVYAGYLVRVEKGWIQGSPGIFASCLRAAETAP